MGKKSNLSTNIDVSDGWRTDNDNLKALIGAYAGVAITKGENIDTANNGSTEKVGDTKQAVFIRSIMVTKLNLV